MELTPFVLLALGDAPSMGLRRFKMEALWRPPPVRRPIQAIFLGSRPPSVDTPVRRALFGWMSEECHWLLPAEEPWGAEAALTDALQAARERALAAEVLDAVRRLPEYSVRVTEYREWFAPEVCLLADASTVSAVSLSMLLRILSHEYRRPIHLALTLPAPHEASWGKAHDLVTRTELNHGPEVLGRLWLLSRERESGELLSVMDVADALSHFCHLLAYSGWTADPKFREVVRTIEPHHGSETGNVVPKDASAPAGLSATKGAKTRLDITPTRASGDTPRLVAWGVRAFRFPAATMARQLALQEAQDEFNRMLAPAGRSRPMEAAEALDTTLVQARSEVRQLVPTISSPVLDTAAGLEDDLAHWRMQVRLRWLPRAAERVADVVRSHLSPFLQQLLTSGQLPMPQLQRLQVAQEAIDQQQETMPRPAPVPTLKEVSVRLLAARTYLTLLIPLAIKGAISTVVVGSGAYVMVGASSVLPATFLMAVFWLIWLIMGYLRGARELAQAMAGLQSSIAHWQSAQVDVLAYGETQRQLADMRRALADEELRLAEVLDRLREARELLDEQEPPDFPPAATSITAEVTGPFDRLLRTGGMRNPNDQAQAPELTSLGSEEMVAAVLAKVGLGGELNLGTVLSEDAQEAMAEQLLSATRSELPPRGLLLHMRDVHPLTGEAQHPVEVAVCRVRPGRPPDLTAYACGGNDPFVVAEFTLTRPFTLTDSPRTDVPTSVAG